MANIVTNPHLTDDYTSLEQLGMQALRRFGSMHPGTVDGDVLAMFIEFANEIVDEYNRHPYNDGKDKVTYYKSITDKRPIHDNIMRLGLIYNYAMQQGSSKSEAYGFKFFRTMNAQLLADNVGTTRPELQTYDKENDVDNV